MIKRNLFFLIALIFLFISTLFSDNDAFIMKVPLKDFQKAFNFTYSVNGKLIEIHYKNCKILLGENSKTYSLNGELSSFSIPVSKTGSNILVPVEETRILFEKINKISNTNYENKTIIDELSHESPYPKPKIEFHERNIIVKDKKSYLKEIINEKENYIKSNYSHQGKIGFEFKTFFLRPDNYTLDEKYLQRHFVTGGGIKWGIFRNIIFETYFGHWYDTKSGDFYSRGYSGQRKIDLKPLSINFYYLFSQYKRTQPYLGVGGSKIYGKYEYRDAGIFDIGKNDIATLNLFVGVEHMINNNFSVFGDVKYTIGDIDFLLQKLGRTENIKLDGLYFEFGGIIWLW